VDRVEFIGGGVHAGGLNGHLKSGHLWSLQKRPFNRERVRQDSFSFLPPDQASPF
jgi:hypothetical protein